MIYDCLVLSLFFQSGFKRISLVIADPTDNVVHMRTFANAIVDKTYTKCQIDIVK